MATIEIDVPGHHHHHQFRYAELRDVTTINPPDVVMTPLGETTVDERGHDPEFDDVIREVEFAINSGVLPELISSGSSGSYFVRDRNSVSTV